MSKFKKYLVFSLILALLNTIILVKFFVPRFDHTDTYQYASTIDYVVGKPDSKLVIPRMLKPMPILIGAALSPLFNAKDSLVAQNVMFYLASVLLVYLLIYRLYKKEKQAFYGTVLYSFAYPMLAYGLAALTDISGWFFYFLMILMSLNFLKKPNIKTACLIGLVSSFGMLFKENMAVAPLFFMNLVLIAMKIPFKEKLKYIFFFGISFLVFPVINSIVMFKLYAYSYWDWFRAGGASSKGGTGFYAISILRVLIETGRVMIIGWLFVLFGIFKEMVEKNAERIKILFSLIAPSLAVYVFWSYPHNRMIFIAAPLLIALASFGIMGSYEVKKVNTLQELSLIAVYVLTNYAILEFLLRYGTRIQPPGTLFG